MIGELFDPNAELLIHEHYRPHWCQTGAIVFLTFRAADSIPREVIERWEQEKQDWVARNGFAEGRTHWSLILPRLSDQLRANFYQTFNRCREDFLDTCHGECVLRFPQLATIVANALLHFDGDRYVMGDFVVMPNHVHALVAFRSPEAVLEQSDSWTHYTAYKINQALGRKGKYWQQEPFDHLVRTAKQYDYLRDYIRDNPKKGNLKPGEYLYRRYES